MASNAKKVEGQAEGSTIGGEKLDNGPADKAAHDSSEAGSVASNAPKPIPAATKSDVSWTDAGKLDAKKIMEADKTAFKTNRLIYLNRAKEFVKHGLDAKGELPEHAKDWLTGFGEIIGATRKSEVRTIFSAAYRQSVQLVVGHLVEGEAIPMETHSGIEWLENVTGTYHDFVRMARRINDKAKGGGNSLNSTGVTVIRSKLTDKQFEKAGELVSSADSSQAAVILQGALDKMNGSIHSDKMYLSTIQGVCIRLSQSKDNAVKVAASKMNEIAFDLLGKLNIGTAKVDAAGNIVNPGASNVAEIIKAPAPAEAATSVGVEVETEKLPEAKAA